MTKLFTIVAVAVALVVTSGIQSRAGLLEGVYETPNATGQSGVVPGVPGPSQPALVGPTDGYITTLQTYLHGTNPTYTYLNNAVTFNYNGGDGTSVGTYLASDAPGVGPNTGSPDTSTNNYNVVYDANGYLKVGTTGSYTFTVNYADDAVRVYVGGNYQVGQSGSLLAEQNYYGGIGPASGTVTLTAGHSYPFEVFTYQGYGGANLSLTVTGPNGLVNLNSITSPTPEPSSFVLCGLGAAGLLLAGVVAARPSSTARRTTNRPATVRAVLLFARHNLDFANARPSARYACLACHSGEPNETRFGLG